MENKIQEEKNMSNENEQRMGWPEATGVVSNNLAWVVFMICCTILLICGCCH